MKKEYFDFSITHALEKLKSNHNITINRECFRKVCHEINLVKKSKRKNSKVRKLRYRTPQVGVMLPMDGSRHRWFNNEESCLIGAIDDASNENYYREFFETETTVGCLALAKSNVPSGLIAGFPSLVNGIGMTTLLPLFFRYSAVRV